MEKHCHQEGLKFLREVESAVPKHQEFHVILHNYVTHKHPKILGWIEPKKWVFLHFASTSASWINPVERFFSTLTQKQIRDGVLPFRRRSRAVPEGVRQDLQRGPETIGLDAVGQRDSQEGETGQPGLGHSLRTSCAMNRTRHQITTGGLVRCHP